MIMHYLFTIPYLTIAFLLLSLTRAKALSYYLVCIALIILCNIPFYHALSFNDLSFSFIGNLSFFSLLFCILLILETLQFKKRRIFFISLKGYLYIALSSLIFFCAFLNIIPLNLYYLPESNILVIGCIFILCSFFVDRILALLYLFCLFAYVLNLFEMQHLFDYLFDVPSFVFAIFAIIKILIQKAINGNTRI